MELKEYSLRLEALVVFRGLLQDPVVEALGRMLAQPTVSSCGEFCSRLFGHTTNWSRYLLTRVLEEENLYVKALCAPQGADELLTQALDNELDFFTQLGKLERKDLTLPDFLPQWQVEEIDFSAEYKSRLADLHRTGYGIFARYKVFTVEDCQLVPVRHPDPQKLSELPGYEAERAKVIANTKALLEGRPANNVLLYGDAGTGKSSAIKAIANEFADQGLRLVEVKKNQLYQIPHLMDSLAANPLKFILFIDDLSFTANDDNFAALKAILEGSVGGRSHNIAVYATSNRRHLIKETLSDREGDDIHLSDTRQELMSLSARFGLTVTFGRPDRDRFALIVKELAGQFGIEEPFDRLLVKAEAFAIRAGGRSPRVARQFMELVYAGVL